MPAMILSCAAAAGLAIPWRGSCIAGRLLDAPVPRGISSGDDGCPGANSCRRIDRVALRFPEFYANPN
eukprot:scaffold22293_cov54-Cyclotella_meneghiniana.AAC.6